MYSLVYNLLIPHSFIQNIHKRHLHIGEQYNLYRLQLNGQHGFESDNTKDYQTITNQTKSYTYFICN